MKITCGETQFCTKIRYDRSGGGGTGTFMAEMFFCCLQMARTECKINGETLTLPPFSLIRDFGKQNTRGNVSKISVSFACCY